MNQITPSGSLDEKLRVLLAKQDIHDALIRYCAGVDRGDLPLILSAFHADARDNHTGVEEIAVARFTRTVGETAAAEMWICHNLGNVLIEVDGNTASSLAYFTASHRFKVDGELTDWVIDGRYIDRFECRDGDWRITYRTVVYDRERFDAVGSRPPSNLFEHCVRGSRTRDDYFYQLFHF